MALTDKHIFFRSMGEVHPALDRATGIYCYDSDGKRYIDGMGGVAVVSIGHGVEEVRAAALRQMDKVSFAHPFHWKNEPHMELTEKIASMAPAGLSSVFMCSGGSEATETALKMARQYHVERGALSKSKVIARWTSYHGNTLGALSMSGMPARRADYLPLLLDFPHIAACNCYRCPFGKVYPDCNLACAQDLEQTILKEGAENISAFIAEPIVGAAGGALTPPPGYFEQIRQICDRHDVLMIADEVITGFGRTGKNFCVDHWGVVPDIICCGKGMSSGYTPLGAVIAHEKVYDVFRKSVKGFTHGYTYGGNPLSCAIGLAVLDYMQKHRLVQHVERLESHFFAKARKLAGLDIVGDVRGKGFLMGIELVADKATKAPIAAEKKAAVKIADLAFSKGLVVGAVRANVDGRLGDGIMLAPPFTCEESDLDEIIDILAASIAEFQSSL